MTRRLLLVDDDTFFRQMLIEILESQGFDVSGARDGEEGLFLFRKTTPDLVITDVRMPRKNGFQMVEEILALAPETPIIFISGWFDPTRDSIGISMAIKKKKSPTLRFLKKPFRISHLLSTLENLLKSSPHVLPGQVNKDKILLKEFKG